MPNTEPQTLILAVPGTQETRELDLESVRDAVARGEIALDNWAWCPAQNDWLPLAQLPEFTPAVAVSEVYEEPAVPVPVAPRVVAPAEPVAVQVPRVTRASARPVIGTPNRMPATYYSKPMEDSREFPIFKVLFFVLGLVIAALVGVNYFLVDQPYRENLAKTPFAAVPTHAHLGAFIQPNALLIHVFPSKEITSDNFPDFLTAMTQCAPSQAFAGRPFASVALTSSWLGEYVISAENWKAFSDMAGLDPDQKRKFVLDHLEQSDGSALVAYVRKDSLDARKAREAKAWDQLVAHFQPKSS